MNTNHPLPNAAVDASAATWRGGQVLLLAAGVLLIAAAGYSFTRSSRLNAVANNASANQQASAPSGTGAADAVRPQPTNAAPGDPPSAEQVAGIVERLAQRMKTSPDDAAGWALLARAYSAMGQYADAVPAYEKAVALSGDKPDQFDTAVNAGNAGRADLLADYADTLAGFNKGRLTPLAMAQIAKALKLEPGNPKALALAGRAAFDAGDYAGAVQRWEAVQKALPPDSAFKIPLQDSITQARQLAGMASTDQAATVKTLSAPNAKQLPGSALPDTVSGTVQLAPDLASRVGPDDTVFVFVRPAEGSRMPLAVLRRQGKDFPFNFVLDDSMAMAPNARLSGQARVIVSARVSKSADAMPQPGDLTGESTVVAPGARGLVITIGKVIQKAI